MTKRRRLVLGAGVVGALIILGVVYLLRARVQHSENDAAIVGASDPTPALLAQARSTCTVDECEQAHTLVTALPNSPWREHADYRYVVSTWAESILRKARLDPDSTNAIAPDTPVSLPATTAAAAHAAVATRRPRGVSVVNPVSLRTGSGPRR